MLAGPHLAPEEVGCSERGPPTYRALASALHLQQQQHVLPKKGFLGRKGRETESKDTVGNPSALGSH